MESWKAIKANLGRSGLIQSRGILFSAFSSVSISNSTHVCACIVSRVWLFVTWSTIVCQAPLSTEFSKQEYWRRLPFSTLTDSGIYSLTQGSNLCLLCLLPWQADSLPLCHLGSLLCYIFDTISFSYCVCFQWECQSLTNKKRERWEAANEGDIYLYILSMKIGYSDMTLVWSFSHRFVFCWYKILLERITRTQLSWLWFGWVDWMERRDVLDNKKSVFSIICPIHHFLWVSSGPALVQIPPHVKSWLIGKDPDAGRDWGQEEKGMTEDEMAGWHHQLNGHEFG